jgi:hypothetical protein
MCCPDEALRLLRRPETRMQTQVRKGRRHDATIRPIDLWTDAGVTPDSSG